MHDVLQRQLNRQNLAANRLPISTEAWADFLQDVDRAYTQSDQDRYLLERSLEVSSREMHEINNKLSGEHERLQRRNQQFNRVYEFARSTLEQMRQTLLLNAYRNELMAYVAQMEQELAAILKEE